jgi:hypothetical protein
MIHPGKNPARALVVLAEAEGPPLTEQDVWGRARSRWPDDVSARANLGEALNVLRVHGYATRQKVHGTYFWAVTDLGRARATELVEEAP